MRHIRVSFTRAAQKMTKMTNTLTLDDKELSSKLDSIVQVRNEVETADDSQCGREDYGVEKADVFEEKWIGNRLEPGRAGRCNAEDVHGRG